MLTISIYLIFIFFHLFFIFIFYLFFGSFFLKYSEMLFAILLGRLSLDFREALWPGGNKLELASLSMAVVLKLQLMSLSLGGLVITHVAGFHPNRF